MALTGKVAVVTGAGGEGSGRAIACRFARDGATVIVADINEGGGSETVRRIEAAGGKAAFVRTDVGVQSEAAELIGFAERTFGGLDALVNDASGAAHHPDPLESWNETMQTELLGTMYATRFAIQAMRRRSGGAIVNISSISALWHGRRKIFPGYAAYDAAKAGVIRLTTGLGWLGEQENIRVNCFAPGWIATPPVKSYWETLNADQRKERGAPSKLLSLEQVTGAVVRLATDESLCGRVLVWWSENPPRLIKWADRGYEEHMQAPGLD